MPASVIADIDVNGAGGYEEYTQLAPPTLAIYGGRYLARGGITAMLEGDWPPRRLVILGSPDAARARQRPESPEAAPARTFRNRTARTNSGLVEGVAGGRAA